MREEPIICEFKYYEIWGIVKLEARDGTTGIIGMIPSITDIDLNDHLNCIPFINDSGFGSKHFIAATIDVYKVYENNAKKFWYSDNLNLIDPTKPVSEEDLNDLNNYYHA